MRKKTIIHICLFVLLLLALWFDGGIFGCAHQQPIVTGISVLSYEMGKGDSELIPKYEEWCSTVETYLNWTEEPTEFDIREYMVQGFNMAVDDPFYCMLFESFLQDINIDIDMPVSEGQILSEGRVEFLKAALEAFERGLKYAKMYHEEK